MGESFNKLKKQALLAAILKSITVGLSSALLTVGVLLLAFKLGSVGFHWALYIPVGLGVALITGGPCFIFLRPTDKKIAKTYDAEYGLNEKLQTMVEFSGKQDEGGILSLQREDALEHLQNAPAPKVRFSRIWYFILIAVISLAIFLTGVIVPPPRNEAATQPPEEEDPYDDPRNDPDFFEFTLEMQTDMDNMTDAVRDISFAEDVQAYMLTRLGELNKTLLTTNTKSAMMSEVRSAVEDIDNLIINTNSFLVLSEAIGDSENPDNAADAELSEALKQGFITYKNSIMKNMPRSYVVSIQSTIGDSIEKAMETPVNESFTKLKVSQAPLDDSKNLQEVLTEYNAKLNGSLQLTQIDQTDALYDSFMTLTKSLGNTARHVQQGGKTDSALWKEMYDVEASPKSGAFAMFKSEAVVALSVQNFKCVMEVFVRQGLEEMLNVKFVNSDQNPAGSNCIVLDELYADIIYTPDENPDEGDKPGDGTGEGSGGGGAGSGDVIFGSDDEVYDPRTGQKVKFGDILKEYENAIINNTTDDFPPELAQYLETYLNYLHNGTGQTKN